MKEVECQYNFNTKEKKYFEIEKDDKGKEISRKEIKL